MSEDNFNYPDERLPTQHPSGEKAPIPVTRVLQRDLNTLKDLINDVRYLKRVARDWYNDERWLTYEPMLKDWFDYLSIEYRYFDEFSLDDQIVIYNNIKMIGKLLGVKS